MNAETLQENPKEEHSKEETPQEKEEEVKQRKVSVDITTKILTRIDKHGQVVSEKVIKGHF